MQNRIIRYLIILIFSVSPISLSAQEVMPRINFAGRGLVSLNGTRTLSPANTSDFSSQNDFSDSFALFQLDKRLYHLSRAGMIIGLQFPDAESDLGQVYFHQVNTFWNAEHWGVRLGRTRMQNTLLEFPTFRDDDLVEYAFVNNAFSNSEASEFQQYGNVLNVNYFTWSSKLRLGIHLENQTETTPNGEIVQEFQTNTAGAQVEYSLPDAVRFDGIIRQIGAGFTQQFVDASNLSTVSNAYLSAAVNLDLNPVSHWELRGQSILTLGDDSGDISTILSRSRANAISVATSLRYLRNPYQMPRFQAALTFAAKSFTDAGEVQWSMIPNLFYQIGAQVDLGLQYQYTDYSGDLAAAYGTQSDQSIKLALIFNFDMTFNNYFSDRNSILNMEHGYIP